MEVERLQTISLCLLGRAIQIESPRADWLETLAGCFEPGAVCADSASSPNDLGVRLAIPDIDGHSIVRETVPAGAFEPPEIQPATSATRLTRTLVQWATHQSLDHYTFHAAALSYHGVGLLLPGASMSGKSTLATALGRSGMEVLSDEVGAVQAGSGMLGPFARALSLRRGSLRALGLPATSGQPGIEEEDRMVRAADLGIRRGASAPVGLVVFPRFDPDVPTETQPLRPAEALLELFRYSCSQPAWGAAGFEFLARLAESVPCYKLTYRHHAEAIACVADLHRRGREDGWPDLGQALIGLPRP